MHAPKIVKKMADFVLGEAVENGVDDHKYLTFNEEVTTQRGSLTFRKRSRVLVDTDDKDSSDEDPPIFSATYFQT